VKGCPVVELCVDVAFESLELVDQNALVGADVGGGGVEAGEGHGDVEAV
jgi:hypothetical protein